MLQTNKLWLHKRAGAAKATSFSVQNRFFTKMNMKNSYLNMHWDYSNYFLFKLVVIQIISINIFNMHSPKINLVVKA